MEKQTHSPETQKQETQMISIGSVIEIRYVGEFEDGIEVVEKVQIVGMHGEGFTGEADQTASLGTPLTQAVLNKRIGEQLTFTGPGGAVIMIEIVSVRS